jgi:hypothetical protein
MAPPSRQMQMGQGFGSIRRNVPASQFEIFLTGDVLASKLAASPESCGSNSRTRFGTNQDS